TMPTVLCAVIAAFVWNIATWWFGLPSSSSHSLIGGLCGAALATAHGNWSVIKWDAGVWPKVIVPMITSPFAGFIFGGLLMFLLFVTLHRFTPHFVHSLFGKLQIFSAAWMAHSHGTNDAQKTMGIITLALFTGTKAGSFDHLPAWLDFLKTPVFVSPGCPISIRLVRPPLLAFPSFDHIFYFLIMFIVGLCNTMYALPEFCSIVSNEICGLQRLCAFT